MAAGVMGAAVLKAAMDFEEAEGVDVLYCLRLERDNG